MRAGGADDLGDDVPRTLDDHVVALTNVLAVDVLLVVQGRAGHRDAADLDRLEHRPGVQGAGAADADQDLVQPRGGRHRRPLERTSPPRAVVEAAQALLLVEAVDLDHEAVDLVVELDPPRFPLAAGLEDRLDRLVPLGERVGAETALAKPVERLPMSLGGETLVVAHPVNPDRERPVGRDRGIELAQRAGGGVSRVRSRAFPLGGEALVELAKPGKRHVDLAADLEERRWPLPVP